MENSNNKTVMIVFGAFAALIGYIVFVGLFKLAGVYDFETKFKSTDLAIRLGSLAIGVLLFFFLNKSDTANQFMHETVTELTRVTWPTHKETVASTWIVVIMVLVTGMILGLFDKFWTLVIQWIL